MHQLGEEIRQLHSEKNELMLQITRKDISLVDAKSRFTIKSEEMQALQSKMKEEIQALQSKVKELEQDVSLVQDDLSEMDSLKRKLELKNVELTSENIGLSLAKEDLEDSLTKKKDKLAQIKDDLVIVQKALIEKDSLLQEANDRLAEQIPKISSEPEQILKESHNGVIGGVSRLEKGNEITSPEITSESPYSLFFQHAIIFIIVLLIIYILRCVFSRLYSSYNEEKNIPNYKIPLNRNQGYAFPIRYAEEPKDRTASYETSSFEYG